MFPERVYKLLGRGRQPQPPAPIIRTMPYRMATPARIIAGECLCQDPTCSLHDEPFDLEPLTLEEVRRRIGAASHYRVKR